METETQALLKALIDQSKESTEAARAAAAAATRAADKIGTLDERIESNRLASVKQHEQTRRKVDAYASRLEELEKRVAGSNPPPAEGPPDPQTGKRARLPSLVEITAEAHETAAQTAERQDDHEGRVLAELARVNARLERQDHAYGIDRQGLARLFGPRNRKRALELVAFVAIVYGVWERSRQADQAAHAPPSSGQPAAVRGSVNP